MPTARKKVVREQVMVYLDARDHALLERLEKTSGLAKTELFRRGLRLLAGETLAEKRPGSSLGWLIATAGDDSFGPDVSDRHDEYLYGGDYTKKRSRKRRASSD